MNGLDVLILVIFAISIFFSFIKGFIREFFSIVSVILGIYLGSFYYDKVGDLYGGFVSSEILKNVLGFLTIFLGLMVISSLLIFLFNKLVKAANLKWLDRLIGMLLGFVRAWLIVAGILIIMVTFQVKENMIERSLFAPYILTTSKLMVHLSSKKIKKGFREEYKKLYKKWIEK